MEPFFAFELVTSLQLALALALGMLVGAERTIAHKSAGMRTYGLVSMGSALFVIIALHITPHFADFTNADPLRIMAAVITGMGFLGAGLIIFHERQSEVTGLTTSAGLWVVAGIGIAVGYQLYAIAVAVSFLTLIAFTAVWYVEEQIREEGDSVFPKTQKKTNARKKKQRQQRKNKYREVL